MNNSVACPNQQRIKSNQSFIINIHIHVDRDASGVGFDPINTRQIEL